MKTLLDISTKQQTINRISLIAGNEYPIWGKMNIEQMICHLTDQIRIALGEKEAKDVSNFALKHIAKNLILRGMPTPKGKINTVPELNQEKQGTPPKNLINDKEELIKAIEDLTTKENPAPHPAFGNMNKKQWNRLAYLHIDHHLRQFGK